MIDGHGDDLHLFKDIKVNFSSNMAIGGTPEILLKHLQKNIASVAHYPRPCSTFLSEKVAIFHGVTPNQITMTSGATDAFYTLSKYFADRFKNPKAAVVSPSFSEYEEACLTNHIPVQHLSFDTLFKKGTSTEICFICNPNNPCGRLVSPNVLEAVFQKNPDTFFVIDEAYMDFSPQNFSFVPFLKGYQNAIVVKSLTKIFTIAGIRLGYFITSPNFTIPKTQMPWKLGVIPQLTATFIFKYWQEMLPDVKKHLALSQSLQKEIQKLEGFEVVSSPLHYFLVKLKTPCSHHLKKFLVNRYGVLIRDAENFKGLDACYIRICAREKNKNNTLLKALSKWNF